MQDSILDSKKVIDEVRQGEALELKSSINPRAKKLYLESYGCAMNFSDSEVVASILVDQGFVTTRNEGEADVILINTCSIRDNAEQRVRNRLTQFNKAKREKPGMIIGILGCMAERLKKNLLEDIKATIRPPHLMKDYLLNQTVTPTSMSLTNHYLRIKR